MKKINNTKNLTQDILLSHTHNGSWTDEYLEIYPDRVVMQDATAQMTLLQFMNFGLDKVQVPASVHCDHLISLNQGIEKDLSAAKIENSNIYKFLFSCCERYGIDFWGPGEGIIHQVVLENYVHEGDLIIGTDSHTPNAGGVGGAIGIGVGGADAVDVLCGRPILIKRPRVIGIELKGEFKSEFNSAKDIALTLLRRVGTKGATNCILEYFGPATQRLTAAQKATICNMGAECGATTSVFPSSLYKRESSTYDDIIEVDLATIEPCINGPFSPDANTFNGAIRVVDTVLIGSCTNSSYDDLIKVANILESSGQDKLKTRLIICPGSKRTLERLEYRGVIDIFKKYDATIAVSACGPCIGQWKRKSRELNTIVTTFNRNFKGRADGNPNTYSYITSPEWAAIIALTGRLDTKLSDVWFDIKHLIDSNIIFENSDRLEKLEPFSKPTCEELESGIKLIPLVQIEGKCTTDHISPAGEWLKYRGNLDMISNNFLSRATCKGYEQGLTYNRINQQIDSIPRIVREYKNNNINSIVIGDENYGEGSSREHAAMEARYLGVRVVLAKSFARIHESNLKKQGILPLIFINPIDYNNIDIVNDVFEIDLNDLHNDNKQVILHALNRKFDILCIHTCNHEQIEWILAGSCANYIKNNQII